MSTDEHHEVLSRYEGFGNSTPRPLGRGLINETFIVQDDSGQPFVLQKVNPIFDRRIHDNIRALTEHLASRGMVTPRLVQSASGEDSVALAGTSSLYRMMTYINGVSFDTIQSKAQARAAGELVGRFHAALDSLEHEFVGTRVGVHDTSAHLERLRRAIEQGREHRLHAQVAALGTLILKRADELPLLPVTSPRICHGDLKLNNILFAGEMPPASERALCLIDLDTVGPMHMAQELGDAWRSWCNPAGEEAGITQVRFDLETFAASAQGYKQGLGREFESRELDSILLGVEWVSLELAARFAADSIFESYFGFDAQRFPAAGEHNFLRARVQWALHCASVDVRDERRGVMMR